MKIIVDNVAVLRYNVLVIRKGVTNMKDLNVKDWFQEKKMNEMHRDVQSTHIVAISKQSEKAAYVTVCSGKAYMSYWCPKSCIVEKDAEHDYDVTKEVSSYDEAVEEAKFYLRYWN